MSVSIETLPDEYGTGIFFFVGKKWTVKTHVGRLAELTVHKPFERYALYDRKGNHVGNFATTRGAKAELRKILGFKVE